MILACRSKIFTAISILNGDRSLILGKGGGHGHGEPTIRPLRLKVSMYSFFCCKTTPSMSPTPGSTPAKLAFKNSDEYISTKQRERKAVDRKRYWESGVLLR